ncbi:TrbG/VirB9 family P-type conjugative transfer protein [Marilutibacter chinensis]|uniref:TrbG/VirB9 family P-type conjugative transfer protein n=1 Tax=Marilutibacter chinensis TaxID=2912247 RepID=A0ABS9HRW3_9GAMM|nr:TrbG/VirB9 family P-type conjugative transfer protein [Lysobacter chinensis]MCF7221671.1 TrbG/VirB9 family P-type conjugative transfer protein [Lysobacter chinensis]
MSHPSQLLLRIGLFLALACTAAPAAAQAVQEYEYGPDRIYPVRTGLGITTQIELSPHEEVLDYSTGFSSGWDLTRRGNVFYLRPNNVDVDTNMMVRTATNSYIFELKVVATDWRALEQAKSAGVQYKIKFVYPSGTEFAAATAAVEEPESEIETAIDPDRGYNFDYEFSAPRRAPKWLVPTTVYDDGRFTYVRMSDLTEFPTGNFPAVFGREREHSDDFIINTTVEGNTIVVHGTYPYLVIRHGKNVVGLRRRQQK